MNAYCREFSTELSEYGVLYTTDVPEGWQNSIESFYKAGLPISQLKRALAIAMTKPQVANREKFRYMCGVAWRDVTEMQERAKEIVEGSEWP
jgi:DNA gyrase inhibitor GyrI